jgi:hypothetical protein
VRVPRPPGAQLSELFSDVFVRPCSIYTHKATGPSCTSLKPDPPLEELESYCMATNT